MKIGTRLWLGLAVLLGFSIVLTAIGAWQLDRVAAQTRDMMAKPLSKERLISDWASNIHAAVVRTTVIAKSEDPKVSAFSAKDAAASSAASTGLLKKIEPLINEGAEKALFDKLIDIRKSYSAGRDAVMKLKAEGKSAEAAAKLEKEFIPISTGYAKHVAELVEMQRKSLDDMAARVDAAAKTSRQLMGALAALIVALGIAGAWALTRSITRPLESAVEFANKVAGGDLTADIDVRSADEVGQLIQALKAMSGSLRKIVSEVRAGTDAISSASSEIATGNADLSQRTEQQASSLEETASSMEELTGTVKRNAENAKQANTLAASASDVAVKGGAVVAQVVETMSSIDESSKKIADIIGVIDGIAFQTNILALNAAVEAARAGEQGRGFAVVASEVRTLAQRSAAAAKEIKTLISESVATVGSGTQLVGEAGRTMDEIVGAVKRVTDIMAEISDASGEQSAGIEQVNQAVMQMDRMTQQNAALVEEAAAAAESMKQQAHQLGEMMAVFRTDDAGAVRRVEIERRAPGGPENVARLTLAAANPRPRAAAPADAAPEVRRTGTDDWTEF
jgi:methyl-accepting chemotaxis protein